jgi:subfamily B ATP-binding cassette protein HlyB/CyaB
MGATLDSLARAGESLGFTTRGVQCIYESLRGFELPFIVHWEGYHYIVVYGISKEWVWIADPALGFQQAECGGLRTGLERHLPAVYTRTQPGAAWRRHVRRGSALLDT